MDDLDFHSSKMQKQKTMCLEDVVTLLPHKDPLHISGKPTSYTWMDPAPSSCAPPPEKIPNTGIDNFKHVLKVYKDEKCENIIGFLEWYNNGDVEVMIPLIQEIQKNYRHIDPSLNLFRDNISLPNISRNIGFNECAKEGGIFHLAKGPYEGGTFERMIRRNLNGGPSIIFDRYHKAYETKIVTEEETNDNNVDENSQKKTTEQLVEVIKTYDANALYSRCMQTWLPVGPSVYQFNSI